MLGEIDPFLILVVGVALLGGTLVVSALNRRPQESESPYDTPGAELTIADAMWAIRHAEVLYREGERMGRELAVGLETGNVDAALDAMSSLGVGTFRMETTKSRATVIVDRGPWAGAPSVGETLCYFNLGLIRAVFGHVTRSTVTITEESCHGTGAPRCSFNLET